MPKSQRHTLTKQCNGHCSFLQETTNEQCLTNVQSSKEAKVEEIATALVEKLGSHRSWEFYCKVAKRIPEYRIWNNLEQANGKGIQNPGGYFNFLCRKDMNEL